MRIFLLFIALFISALSSFSQIIDNSVVDIITTQPLFNKEYIRQKKIRSITAHFSSKPDNQVIIDKGLIQKFEFDELGKIILHYHTRVKSSQSKPYTIKEKRGNRTVYRTINREQISYDTVFTYFYYDHLQRLIVKRSVDGDLYDAYYFEYDLLNRITKELHCKETNLGTGRTDFRIGVQNIISLETFEYLSLAPNQVKKKCLNDEGKVYKEAIIRYDNARHKTDENYEFTYSWVRIGNRYKYDAHNKLVEKHYTSNAGGELKETATFEYDDLGNLTMEKRFKNDVKLAEHTYMYDKETKFLKNFLSRNFLQRSIDIVKYTYEFY